MLQLESGYQRKLLDQHETPGMGNAGTDPAPTRVHRQDLGCGGQMVAALWQAGFDVVGSDITQGVDFLGQAPEMGVSATIINPPLRCLPKRSR
jgi:hypothetical protein